MFFSRIFRSLSKEPRKQPHPICISTQPNIFMQTHDPREWTAPELAKLSRRIRRLDLETVYRAGAGHLGGEMSVLDLLTVLYFRVLRVGPQHPEDPQRDRLVLSKGHTACALYCVLAERGFLAREALPTFLGFDSPLNGHPNRVKVPGVETNTGPLGHGLPVGVGMAKAAQLSGADWRTFVVCGDGELQEGSNWEAAMAAAHHRLDGLTLLVDVNRLQQGARVEETNGLGSLEEKFMAFGWAVREVDGHDHGALLEVLEGLPAEPGAPTCILAHTRKGRGISFMEDRVEWHHKVPSPEQYEQAMAELETDS